MERAVGIIRVSKVGKRKGERFISPKEQRQRIEDVCERKGVKVVQWEPEMDVKGGAPLEKRKGVLKGIEAIENGRADLLVSGYFDRLVRSLKVQGEIVERVEAANGRVELADFGELSNDTAAKRLTGTMMGAVVEFVRLNTAEKLAEAQQMAIDEGRWPLVPIPGLRKNGKGQFELDPDLAPAVADAFRFRLSGHTIAETRDFLKAHGIDRTYHGTQCLLESQQAVGVLKFGDRFGTCPALIDQGTWDRVQRLRLPRGRKPKSERILARLGVLYCDHDEPKRMTVGVNNKGWWLYRCPSTLGCPKRMAIGAEMVEGEVIAYAKKALAGLTGRANGASGVAEAKAKLERTEDALEKATRSYAAAGIGAEPASIEVLNELRQVRDNARDRYEDELHADKSLSVALTAGDWDDLTLDGKRDLIKAVIKRVVIHPGRGVDRIEIEAR